MATSTLASTTIVEPIQLQSSVWKPSVASRRLFPEASSALISSAQPHDDVGRLRDALPRESPSIASDLRPQSNEIAKKRWNYPRTNILRLGATFLSFLVSGANDAAYGALIPYLETYYGISYTAVSLIFLSPFVGAIVAAGLNNLLHLKFGQRGIGFACATCRLIGYVIISQHPPYPVLIVVYVIIGFGGGLANGAWNAWVGNLARANELLGCLHASYGMGGIMSPLIATTMITKANVPWYAFYYVMIGLASCELVVSVSAFWHHGAEAYRKATQSGNEHNADMKTALTSMPHARVTWLCSIFVLAYVGAEVSLGGWIVQFMIRVRDANPFPAGMTSVGFWLGITLGRAILGFVTPIMGVKLAVALYLPAAMALELVFWLVPQFYVSAVAVALQGFFIGPLFPAVIIAMTKLLPLHLHVGAIGFASAFGGSGAAVLPFAIGAIAQSKGVQVLQPIVLSFFGLLLILWLCLPRIAKKRD